MTFLTPLFLLAAAAAAIPVVLHMISRQKAKELPFATLRFLRISVQKTRRRKRVHDLLLMLLRMAVLILIALGLAGPTITSLANLWTGGAHSAVAIILDNSASMGIIDRDRARFETAVRAARQILDELEDGDQIALFLTGGPFEERNQLDYDKARIDELLAQCSVSYEKADLGVKLQQARKLLDDSNIPNKQIYVLSDLQELSWETFEQNGADESDNAQERLAADGTSAEPRLAADGTSAKPDDQAPVGLDIPVIFVDCNRAPKTNVAVAGITLGVTLPVTDVPIKISAELLNDATVEQQRHIELLIDGQPQATSPELAIPAGGWLKYDFEHTFKRGGVHHGEVRLAGEDGSGLDDRRFFSIEIDQGIPVAVVKPEKHEIPYLEESFYLEQALAPGRSGGWAIRTTPLVAGDLLSEPLAGYEVIFCVNLPAPEDDVAARLRTYVERGGNLVWICGDNVDPEAYNRMNRDAGDNLLPAPLVDVRTPGAEDDRDSWHINTLDKKHPALRILAEPASMYQSVLVYKHIRMATADHPEARVLAGLDDGEAVLAERRVGDGRVLMLSTSAHIGWSNLPLRPIFLPLVTRLTFNLAGAEDARHTLLAGSPLVMPVDDVSREVGVEVVPPSGETIRLTTEDAGAGRQEFRYNDTHQVGVYRLRLLESARGRQIAYSVNFDSREADARKIERETLQARFGTTPVLFADPDKLSSTFDELRQGKSLWSMFLTGVLIVLVFETFVSNRLSPKKEEEEGPQPPPGMRRLAKQHQGV